MTRDDLERFLKKVGAPRLGAWLGGAERDGAILALEERIAWAVVHRNEPEHAEVADFLARNVDALKAVLDEGEEAWWERTASSARVRKPSRGGPQDWEGIATFTTPPVPPGRSDPAPDVGDITLDEPLDLPRKTLRKGRNAAPAPRGGGQTLLPEALDTPGAPVRDAGPGAGATWMDDDDGPVDPDATDPIGFAVVPLSANERERDQRLAATPAPAVSREAAMTYIWRQADEEEETDPRVGPTPAPAPSRATPAPAPRSTPAPQVRQTPPPPPQAAPPPRASWVPTIALLLGGFALIAGIVALLFVLSSLGRRQGERFARDAWEEAHVTSSVSVEPPSPEAPAEPPPHPAAVPATAPPSPAIEPAPSDPPRVSIALRDPGFLPPAGRTEPPALEPARPPSLRGSTWVGTGGMGPLTLHVDAHAGNDVRGRLVRLVGGLSQTSVVTGTWDPETGALALSGEGVAFTGTLEGTTARGTWAPDGTPRQWVLARQ